MFDSHSAPFYFESQLLWWSSVYYLRQPFLPNILGPHLLPGLTLYLDSGSICLDQGLGDCQLQPNPLDLGGEQWLKGFVQILFWCAFPSIGQRDGHPLRSRNLRLDHQLAALRDGLVLWLFFISP